MKFIEDKFIALNTNKKRTIFKTETIAIDPNLVVKTWDLLKGAIITEELAKLDIL
jgi:hypothetical protein